jgi:diguanylate cyclase (GGDEF)-like protein/PAS domain S-box-containing protein
MPESTPQQSGTQSAAAAPASPGQDALALLSGLVAAVELTPLVAVRSFDRNGIVCFWNQAAARLYGVAAADAVGQAMTGLVSYGAREQEYLDAVGEAWRGTEPLPSRDWQVSAADGRTLWIYSSMFPVYRDGRLEQVFCMDVDITERKREEASMMPLGGNFRQLFEKSADAILLIQNDRILEINPAATLLFRCGERQRMLGQRLSDFSPLQQPSGLASTLLEARMAEQAYHHGNCRYDWRYLNCQGELFWAEVLLTSVTLDHEYLFYAVIRDISSRKQVEQSLYLSAQVFENARDAILVTDTGQRIVAVNRAYTDITGFAAADMMAQPLNVYRGGIVDEHFYQQIWEEVAANGHWQGEIDGRRKNGELYPAWLSVTVIRDALGNISNYMGILSDITDRKKSEEHTRHLAEHDFLTDLPNRVLLLDRLSLALVAARRKHTMLAILFLDLDHFKNINDTMGHHVGDLLLKEVARRLIKCVRGVDTVSRQGGDEFVIILADIGGIDQAAHIAASVLQAVTQVYAIGEYELHVSTSIGVSIFPSDGDDIETLIKNADIAMYHAKENGRDGFQFFDADMNAQIVERVTFENGLREALANDEFILEYQPEIDIASGGMVGAEALIRWQHPQLGLLLPERFIGVAEESGLMIPIGNWVLNKACQQGRRWHDAGYRLVVAVNLSVGQFIQKNLVNAVREALRLSGLPPSFLELEITEAIIMKHGGNTIDTLSALRALGVKLTIDDFGTGYSRLGLLRDYPIDKLKIDQSFMADITSNPADAAVITAIIAMARSLKMKVIAEGVETAGQLQFLRDQGCDEYQGFYASSAVLATELGKMLPN